MIAEVEQPGIGRIKIFNMTAKLSRTLGAMENPPLALSQHTDAILTELGYTAEERQLLKSKMVF